MKNFIENTSGNIAVTLALIATPLIVAAGAALDYSQLARKQSNLQNVTDSAALAVTQDIMDLTEEEVYERVMTFMKANLTPEQYAEITDVTVNISSDKSSLNVQASGNFPTTLMSVAGIKTLNYQRESVVNIGTSSAEIMMVLDTTGSMALNNKMDDLKVAATQFINDAMPDGVSSSVKIGIVPFAQYVNVGIDNRNADWMDVPQDRTDTVTRETREVISTGTCMSDLLAEFRSGTMTIPTSICDEVEYGPLMTNEVTVDFEWNGCAGSRNHPLNLNDEDFSFKVPGILGVDCPTRITELSTNKQTLLDGVDALNPNGSTYIPAGLVWGYRALTDGDPFGEAASFEDASSNNIQKVLILMSDGQSVSSINEDNPAQHSGTDVELTDQYTTQACDNIKNAGIRLFTIGFGTSIPAETLDLLKACSTDGANYYDAQDGDALAAAFENINGQLSSYYLSR